MSVENVLRVFESFRMAPLAIDQYEQTGKAVLRGRISPFITANEPIKFSIMGFPMKSPNNRDKVIGKLPDLAEEVTIKNFITFNDEVKKVYSPGIQLAVVSDGLIFNDVMEVDDTTVYEYQAASQDLVGSAPIKWFNMRDFYAKELSLSAIRSKIIEQFGITPEELQRRILLDADVNYLYKGMIRFMNLDLAIKDYSSKTQLQNEAKKLAKTMMFRNEAYSKLVQKEFSDHIRLSMHPSINNGVKYSFQLIRSPKAYTSAWHCALAMVNGVYETIHRMDAERLGYELVSQHGRPYYYAG